MPKKLKIETIRHSLSHIMASAVKELFPRVKFGIGPAIENGFYYDFDLSGAPPRKGGFTPADLQKIEKRMKQLIKKNIIFKKKRLTASQIKKIFEGQPYKLELISELPKKNLSFYESGVFIDLCAGPHVKATKELPLNGFKLTKIAGAYWRGDEKKPMLSRIYGVAFKNKKELDDYLGLQKEIQKRDHRKLGEKLDLFTFHSVAPGAPFWHPKGMIILKELEKWWREEHDNRGYVETSTPIMVKKDIFVQSGHWKHYRENMFTLEADKETYVLKPMNCPESTLIYSHKIRSYKDLPLRLSEIGRLHRNELSGVMTGLFRVRQITMDDAHIYAAPEQIQEEISNIIKLIKSFYRLFNFKPEFRLATRPDSAMGSIKLWQKAQRALKLSLKQNKLKYEIKPKDAAFYGPKIDVHITDSLKRSWQIATVQLDFQMPDRFKLTYVDKKGRKRRPVMIHRAIFGSFERFIGILIEHYAGNLPLWLAPEQLWVIPVGSRHIKYAQNVGKKLKENGFRCKVRKENETVSKKIRNGEMQKIPYLLVVGDKEAKKKSVRVRKKGKDLGEVKLTGFITKAKIEIDKKK